MAFFDSDLLLFLFDVAVEIHLSNLQNMKNTDLLGKPTDDVFLMRQGRIIIFRPLSSLQGCD